MERRAHEFVTESREHLGALEQLFLSIEQSANTPGQREAIDHCLRIAHSLKGDAGFLGLAAFRAVADGMETVLERIRDRALAATPAVLEALLVARDRLASLTDNLEGARTADVAPLLARLEAIAGNPAAAIQDWNLDLRDVDRRRGGRLFEFFQTFEQLGVLSGVRIELPPNDLSMSRPEGPVQFRAKLQSTSSFEDNQRRLGLASAAVSPGTASPASVPAPIPICIDLARWTNAAQRSLTALLAELASMGSLTQVRIEMPPHDLAQALPAGPWILHGQLSCTLSAAELTARLQLPEDTKSATPAMAAAETPRTAPSSTASAGSGVAEPEKTTTLRIQVELLDRLMTLIGELTLVRNQALLELGQEDRSRSILQRLNSVTSDLQATALRTRMQPVGNLFSRFPRVVRDLGHQLGKQVELNVVGRDVELDKTILEQLSDPLTHLVRNSVDHGIETPDRRVAGGKPPVGRITLTARHVEGQVQIEIQDDGRGINPQAVREKALSSRLKTDAELNAMSERELISLILLPGFSTAGAVTEVSGRGVGMDVVKTNLELLEGTLTIDSELGVGTKMVLRVPLTLAIIPCLIVLVDGERFALPQRDIEEIVCLHPGLLGRLELSYDTEIFRLRDRLLPIIRLREVFSRRHPFTSQAAAEIVRRYEEQRTRPTEAQYIVVVQSAGKRYGLLVDEVRGTEEIVVKPMQAIMKGVRIFSGATIMGDGRVALIANVAAIVDHCRVSLANSTTMPSTKAATPTAREPSQVHRLLLFQYGPDEQFALPLLQIRRIVAIRREQIERVGEHEHVIIDGVATRLARLDRVMQVSGPEPMPTMHAVLPKFVREPVALLISTIVDCDSLAFDLQTPAGQQAGVLGTAIVRDRLTLFLDMHYLCEQVLGPRPSADAGEHGNLPQVLLIDDTSFFREAVGRYLSGIGIAVTSAVDGEDGLRKMAEGRFDLVVSDIEMPVMDGWQFARAARERGYRGPLLALSSLARADHEARARECGYDYYEEKLNHDRLVQTVRSLLAGELPGMRYS